MMELRYLFTQVGGMVLAALAGWRAGVELRRDWKLRRIPLLRSPAIGRVVLVAFAGLALCTAGLIAIFRLGLVPAGSPIWFAVTFGWASIGSVLWVIAVGSRQIRSAAAGWLVVEGEETLRLEVDGDESTLLLRAGAVRAYFIDGGPQYVQFVVTDGEKVVRFWGTVGIRDMKLVTEGVPVRSEGLMVANSMNHLVRWLHPFITSERNDRRLSR